MMSHLQGITERHTEQRSMKEGLVILLAGAIGITAPTRLGSTRWPYAFLISVRPLEPSSKDSILYRD